MNDHSLDMDIQKGARLLNLATVLQLQAQIPEIHPNMRANVRYMQTCSYKIGSFQYVTWQHEFC